MRGLAAMLGMGSGRGRSSSRHVSATAASTAGGAPATASAPVARHWLARMVTPVLLVLAAVAAVSILVVPTRSHLERSATISSTQQQLNELVAMNEADSARLAALRTDDELEYLARRDFGLAMPGEEIYHVLSPAVAPPRIPQGWPFNYLSLRLAVE